MWSIYLSGSLGGISSGCLIKKRVWLLCVGEKRKVQNKDLKLAKYRIFLFSLLWQ
jgi:hypothetical protein